MVRRHRPVCGQPQLHTLAGTVNFLSYFTILSNILVASTFTAAAVCAGRRGPGASCFARRWRWRPRSTSSVTGLIYYFILSGLYHLQGWTRHFDHLLHYVMPPAFVLFWLLFVPKGTLHLRNVAWMMVPPLVYGAWTLFHGALSGFYPYPFIDVCEARLPACHPEHRRIRLRVRVRRRGVRVSRSDHPPPRLPVAQYRRRAGRSSRVTRRFRSPPVGSTPLRCER